MDSLHRKPTTNNGLVHNITPENAGWRYVGFDLYRLSSGNLQMVPRETVK